MLETITKHMPSLDWDIQVKKGNDFPSLNEYHKKASLPGSGQGHKAREGRETEKYTKQRYDKFQKPARLVMTPEE